MQKINLNDLKAYKQTGEKFAVLTAYDACFANIVSTCDIEMILVGDSLGMVLQGNDSTLPVSMDDMIYHTKSVAQGNQGSMIMSDLPFMSYTSTELALKNSASLMAAGANMVKLEGGAWLENTVAKLTECGIPVCAHLGLMPQSINMLGEFKVQGRDKVDAEQILKDSLLLEQAGATVLLVECIPATLAAQITAMVNIPVIGIGAGAGTDAQVLVLHDMLGLTSGKQPRFVKDFLQDAGTVQDAIKAYSCAVKAKKFPAPKHCFE